MHLGRRPSRLPAELEGLHGIPLSSLDPRAAWATTVERALELEVDAVLLAGDVVDSKNHFMEAYGALFSGVERLAAAGVDVVAVAGNHDVTALPRLARELEGFTLLGRGGQWATHLVRRAGEPLVRVLGWSFPRRRVESNPLDALPDAWRGGRFGDGASDDLPTVGLLHCDLDSTDRDYAPVPTAAFAQLGLSAWFLGHIHQPSIHGGGRPLGYLGSLVGLDPGEQGVRGPWLATSEPGRWELEQLVLSPILWESLEVDLTGCEGPDALEAASIRAMKDLARHLGPRLEGTRAVGLRPRFVGRTQLTAAERRLGAERAANQLQLKLDGVVYFVDRIHDDTRPALDLEALAARQDPLALVARRLLDLQEGGEACAALVAAARPRLEAVASHGNFGALQDGPPGDEEVRALLMRTAARALEELLAQKSERAESEPLEEVRG